MTGMTALLADWAEELPPLYINSNYDIREETLVERVWSKGTSAILTGSEPDQYCLSVLLPFASIQCTTVAMKLQHYREGWRGLLSQGAAGQDCDTESMC